MSYTRLHIKSSKHSNFNAAYRHCRVCEGIFPYNKALARKERLVAGKLNVTDRVRDRYLDGLFRITRPKTLFYA